MKYTVSKSITINSPVATISENVANLSKWQAWSPWACLDPQAKMTSSPEQMAWESKFIGSGNMSIQAKTAKLIDIDLNFIKPFKSNAAVTITLNQDNDNTTTITWKMHSKLPLFMCFFKKLFQVMIGRDFERGLVRLKALCETGTVPTRLEFIDTIEKIESFKIAGVSSSCSMNAIPENMKKAFTKLCVLIDQVKITPVGSVCFCYNVKLSKETMDYTAAVIYNGDNVKLAELHSKEITAHKVIKVILHGSYEFMGDAWSGAHAHLRGLKLKMDKKVPPYEVYIKGPHNCENPTEYVTEIRFPVK